MTAQIVIRFAQVARGSESSASLLARVGLAADLEPSLALEQSVDIEAYYDLLERAGDGDDELPYRYAASLRPEDFGALGLALKTASSVHQALQRIARYILVLSDSLEYELTPLDGGQAFVLRGRPHHRRGACLANEAALAAATSLLRHVTEGPVRPLEATFRHAGAAEAARQYFECPVRFGVDRDALHFDDETLAQKTRLGDDGLSAFLLDQLEREMRERHADSSLESHIHRAVVDALCDGPPSCAQIAGRLGLSERTLRRRLTDEGLTFSAVVDRARREVAESLLNLPDHTLAEVAYLTGFSDQTAFQRAFKRWSGKTPLAFRQGSA